MIISLMLVPGAATARTLTECTRTTHVSHGGEADHRDLGEGRVMWRDRWSQEGTATSYAIVDCGSAEALTFRTAEENMGKRLPFDRTRKALNIVERHESGARVFATLERSGSDLDKVARDIELTTLAVEPCACAVLYPDAWAGEARFALPAED